MTLSLETPTNWEAIMSLWQSIGDSTHILGGEVELTRGVCCAMVGWWNMLG